MNNKDCTLFPTTPVSEQRIVQKMAWDQLRLFGDDGATPSGLTDHLLKNHLASGSRDACVGRVAILLEDMLSLAGGGRVERVPGGRYRAVPEG